MTTLEADDTDATLSIGADEARGSAAPLLGSGETVGRYVVLEPLGAGGMGVVYKAYDPQLNRGIALKLIRIQGRDEAAREQNSARLLREAQALAQLAHPNVVAIHDVGTVEGQVFLAMELVEGTTVDRWAKQTTRDWRSILDVMLAAGHGLAAAHAAGMIHRDFKPANVVIGHDGRPRVIDFGLARARDSAVPETALSLAVVEMSLLSADDTEEASTSAELEIGSSTRSSSDLLRSPLTRMGSVMGTPGYMSPEQYLGVGVDERSDQFAFCVALYELLYGKLPFVRRNPRAVAKGRFSQPPTPPPKNSEVPRWVGDVIAKGLQVDRAQRYASMADLLAALSTDPEAARRAQRARQVRRAVAVVFMAAAVLVPLVVWRQLEARRALLCQDAPMVMERIWQPQTKAALKQALLATGVSYAADTAARVERILSTYADGWMKMRTEACKATRVFQTQSESIMDLRMRCLDRRLEQMKGLIAILSRADADAVKRAAEAAHGLDDVAGCADIEALTTPVERMTPPKDERTAKQVESVRAELARAKTFDDMGKYAPALELGDKALSEARALDYLPLKAEALMSVGWTQERLGQHKTASENLRKAFTYASASHHDALQATSAGRLIWVEGWGLANLEEAQQWARLGADAERSPAVAGVEKARRLNNMAGVLWRNADYDKALSYYREAIAIFERVLPPGHPLSASALTGVGLALAAQAKYDEALAYLRRALTVYESALGPEHPSTGRAVANIGLLLVEQERYEAALPYLSRALQIQEQTFGADHPHVAMALANLGLANSGLGRYDVALPYLRRAIPIAEKTLGADHPDTALPLQAMGEALVAQNAYQQALVPLERAVAICAKAQCQPEVGGPALLDLAKALVATGGSDARAIGLATQAREVMAKAPERFKKRLRETDTFLQERTARPAGLKASAP